MSENLIMLSINDVTTIDGACMEAQKLFMHLEKHHGADEARKIFREWGKKLTKNRINELKAWALLRRYDAMERPNVSELARQVVAENAALPEDNQLTPRFRPTLPTVDKYLRLLLTKRGEGLKNGTWEGPACMKRWHREVEQWIETGSSSD